MHHDYILIRFSERYDSELALQKMQQLLAFKPTDEGIGFWEELLVSRVDEPFSNSVMFNSAISEWLNGFTK